MLIATVFAVVQPVAEMVSGSITAVEFAGKPVTAKVMVPLYTVWAILKL